MRGTNPRVASLHLHPKVGGQALQAVESFEVEAGKGIVGNPRHFARRSRSGGPRKRQVSLIEREQIGEHAVALGLESIGPGVVRANIETLGINLMELVGREVEIGTAVLFFYEPRTPCFKMDDICQGMKELMKGRQGVMAQVIQSGRISVGDEICLVSSPSV